MKNFFSIKKCAIFAILIFLISVTIPLTSSTNNETPETTLNTFENIDYQENATISCHMFGTPTEFSKEINVPRFQAEELYDKIKELQTEIANNPQSEKIQQLQLELAEFSYEYGLLPKDVSQNLITHRSQLIDLLELNSLKNHKSTVNKASEFLCNFVSTGSGTSLPIIILPRLIPVFLTPIPRALMIWNTKQGVTSCGGLYSNTGFIAYGEQNGIAIGFWGVGFTINLPPIQGYAVIGYALYANVNAEQIQYFPPNNPPVISSEQPANGAKEIPLTLSELSFHISDPEKDFMSYKVSTDPDIGSGNGILKIDGKFTVPISDLECGKTYRWKIEVDDGKNKVEKEFYFYTKEIPPFDPFDEGWKYRKKITIDQNNIAGNFIDYPILIDIKDIDLKNKAQNDGDDILFMENSGISEKLYHETEFFDGNSGVLTCWVCIPNIVNNEGTTFYIYYGNPSCTSQESKEKVWNSNYKCIYHFSEITELIRDSTYQNFNGIVNGDPRSEINGKIGPAIEFDGIGDYVCIDTVFGLTNGWTFEFWVKVHSNDEGYILSLPLNSLSSGIDFGTFHHDDSVFRIVHYSIQSQNCIQYASRKIADGDWYYCVATYDGNIQKIFVNGIEEGSDPMNGYSRINLGKTFIGGFSDSYNTGINAINGIIDEVRISNIARSPEWISTSYANQNNPSTFLLIGEENQR